MVWRRRRSRSFIFRRAKSFRVVVVYLSVFLVFVLCRAFGVSSLEDAQFLAEDLLGLVVIGAAIIGGGVLLWSLRRKLLPARRSVGASQPFIKYLRQSYIDDNKGEVDERELEANACVCDWSDLERGEADVTLLSRILKQHEESGGDSRRDLRGSSLPTNIEVLVAPIVLSRDRDRGLEDLPNTVVPFLIPAEITTSGIFVRPRHGTPWIPRNFLEPVSQDGGVILGELKELEGFSFDSSRWADYWREAEQLFGRVTNAKFKDFSFPGYKARANPLLLLNDFGGSKRIEWLYNDILKGRLDPGLINSLIEPQRKTQTSPQRFKSGALQHSGQFDNAFALAPSQRLAVQEALLVKPGEILAVTGPPGTGKTTLIQSVVASLWINGVRSGVPPFIVSCSETNQATMNVIDCFSNSTVRWLPNFSSYGLFCSSERKSRELTDTFFTLSDGSGPLAQMENQTYVAHASTHFLKHFSSTFFACSSLNQAAKHLKREVIKLHESICSEIYRGEDLTEKLEQLDTTTRFQAFQLAIHYWEARWLLDVGKIINGPRAISVTSSRQPSRLKLAEEHWRIRAMLTPCFVSTFSMAPEFFGLKSETAPIDLLISDEASQVLPATGAAAFALARRALIIGDPAQLEPLWTVPPQVDRGNLTLFGLEKKYDHFSALGALANNGSLMRMALSATKIGDDAGIFLAEHRRSVPEIVTFLNELSYGGKLQAKRGSLTSPLFPPFSYIHQSGVSESVGRSRSNREEARGIAKWLEQHGSEIERRYSNRLENVLAILTPFTAQVRLLKQLLHPQYPGLIIGTVNSLQGAERELVIFSPTYESSIRRRIQTLIFDRTPNMLNVAVSRAKDAFIVIGDVELFRTGSTLPSGVLGKFLFANAENDLTQYR